MFGLVIAGRPIVDGTSLQSFSPTEHAFTVPAAPPFAHLTVFLAAQAPPLLPDTAVAVFIRFPPAAGAAPHQQPEFKLLGGLSADKPSAIFRVRGMGGATDGSGGSSGNTAGAVIGEVNGVAEVDMDADDASAAAPAPGAPAGDVTVGFLVQPAAQLAPQLAALRSPPPQASQTALAPYRAPPPPGASRLPVKVLAQRIIRNAFNYLASFAQGRAGGGDEVVPLRSLEAWARKIEARIDADPSFLEREGEGEGA